jgi:broad specificity phosphatase PhoE
MTKYSPCRKAPNDDVPQLRTDPTLLSGAETRSSSVASESCGSVVPATSCASSPSHSLSGTHNVGSTLLSQVSEDVRFSAVQSGPVVTRRRIFLARHAESVVNAANAVTQAVFDPPLSAAGQQQAAALGLEAESMDLDTVLTSTLRRALETSTVAFGGYVSDRTLDFVPMVALDELREVVGSMQIAELRRPVRTLAGEYPGISFGSVSSDRIDPMAHYAINLETKEAGPGERNASLLERARRVAWLLLFGLPAACKSVAVVSHYHLLLRVVEELRLLAASDFSGLDFSSWCNSQVVAVEVDLTLPSMDSSCSATALVIAGDRDSLNIAPWDELQRSVERWRAGDGFACHPHSMRDGASALAASITSIRFLPL